VQRRVTCQTIKTTIKPPSATPTDRHPRPIGGVAHNTNQRQSPASFMLATLRIRNLALVPDLTLDLHPGLNVVTGETGAGKSVILGAIQLAIGQRADRTAIRAGADLCAVEAVFNASRCQAAVDAILASAGIEPCEAGALVIRRSISLSGVNRQFINGSPTTLATLACIGQCLVDLHGPHDHQSLLQPARQLDILDAFGNLTPLRESFADAVRQRDQLRRRLDDLLGDSASAERQRDLLQYQLREIEAARLHPGEEESLSAEFSKANNSARLIELTQSILYALAEDDDSVTQRLEVIGRSLHEITRLDPAAAHAEETHSQACTLLRDLQQAVDRYAHTVEVDPEHLATLTERLHLIQSLRRKYGNTAEAILAFAAKAKNELLQLESTEETASTLQSSLATIESQIAETGAHLRAQRHAVAPRLAKATIKELATLGFRQSGFQASLEPSPGHDAPSNATATGMDQCDFLFAPNPGEPPRPLRAIASSGELARVMLALKTVLAHEDSVPVLVFDEVDSNVGGETAHAVGRNLRRIAKDHQVICISHLAPVAAMAQAHYLVTKDIRDGRTESRIQMLGEVARAQEIGRMLGGGTAATLHAQELLRAASQHAAP